MKIENNRQIILDTETTGMNMIGNIFYEGHRIIEIGAVEIINRRLTGKNFHVYLNPDRLVDPEAFKVHGISNEFLIDKPRFVDIADEFLKYIQGSELIIHNALFDIGFIDYEFSRLDRNIGKVESFCKITDSLIMARKMFPGKRNSLDALCSRYKIDNSKRDFHGALLDAQILAEIFLIMTGGQTSFLFLMETKEVNNQYKIAGNITQFIKIPPDSKLRVILANKEEIDAHEAQLDLIQKKSGICLWRIKFK